MAEEQQSTEAAEPQAAADGPSRGRQQVKVGTVTSARMDKTVVVAVDRPVMHRLYKRSLKRSSRFTAHDEENSCREGDVVELVSTRPLSKRKRWRVRRIVKRAEG